VQPASLSDVLKKQWLDLVFDTLMGSKDWCLGLPQLAGMSCVRLIAAFSSSSGWCWGDCSSVT